MLMFHDAVVKQPESPLYRTSWRHDAIRAPADDVTCHVML